MAHAIVLYYDRSTPENEAYSDNIVAALASRGIAFGYEKNNFVEKNFQGEVVLGIEGTWFFGKDCEKDLGDILRFAKKVDNECRERSQLAKADLPF